MKQANKIPPKEIVEKYFGVDFDLGYLINKPRKPEDFNVPKKGTQKSYATMWNKQHAWKSVGISVNTNRYLTVQIEGKGYGVHRIIYFLYYGKDPEFVDHINGLKNDNKIKNLRSVSHLENCKNIAVTRRNTSGHIGVFWHKGEQKWGAKISDNGKRVYLGYYTRFKAAVSARKKAERQLGYHKNHGDVRPRLGEAL